MTVLLAQIKSHSQLIFKVTVFKEKIYWNHLIWSHLRKKEAKNY